MMGITYSVAWILWLLNMIWGNKEDSILFKLFILTSYGLVLAPVVVLVLEYVAYQSYGNAA